MLDHAVSIGSAVGKGSVFGVEIPWMRDVRLPQRAAASMPAGAQHKPLAGMVIAAIDNEPTILAGMAVLCEGWGCRFAGGKDLEDILAELVRRDLVPDALVADYHLDESDGILMGALRHGTERAAGSAIMVPGGAMRALA